VRVMGFVFRGPGAGVGVGLSTVPTSLVTPCVLVRSPPCFLGQRHRLRGCRWCAWLPGSTALAVEVVVRSARRGWLGGFVEGVVPGRRSWPFNSAPDPPPGVMTVSV
jgi:hypothetical protein